MKKFLIVFITICISVLAVPLVAMIFRPTTESTDNRKLAQFPAVTKPDGSLNVAFFSGFYSWFSDHFAFRNELIYADANIQNDVFKVSNVDNVISGRDGWLFYTSTLKDYLGTDRMSDREIYNIAHNISIAYDYVKDKGCKFVLTVPANKNTLYGEYMPYYDSYIVDNVHNIDALTPLLNDMQIPYADLVKSFKDEEEILYLKTDSHWNNKGAVLAYNNIMDTLELPHDDYSSVNVTMRADEAGDLSKMMYTFYGQKEPNYYYDIQQRFEYSDAFKSVEDGRIETNGTGQNGDLLMFRDSFGNTLIPLIANEFANGRFSREAAYSLEKYIEESRPDVVVFEKVERNIGEFIKMPPVIAAPVYDSEDEAFPDIAIVNDTEGSNMVMKTLELDSDYYEISGELVKGRIKTDSDIIINVNGTYYKAYHTGECGYSLYLKKEDVTFPAVVYVNVTGMATNPLEKKTFLIDNVQ